MKIGIITDVHYSSKKVTCGTRYNSRSLQKLRLAYDYFRKEGCERIVCLGDLIDTEDTVELEMENLRRVGGIMAECPIPTDCLMGNHDAFVLTPEQFYSVLGAVPPKDKSCGGRNLLFLDACYFRNGCHYAPGDSDWTDTFLPCGEELRKKLEKLSAPTYVFIHQNLDPDIREDHRVHNAEEICRIIERSGIVKAVFQGHYHSGYTSEHNGVRYITLPAVCENEQSFWTFEL